MSRVVTAVCLVLALALWVPLALTTTPWPPRFALWPIEVGLGGVALVLLATTKPELEKRVVPGLRHAGLRSVLGAFVVAVGTWSHILAGGGGGFVQPATFIETGAVLGLLLGPLVAALLTGWGALLALMVGWVQAHYFAAITGSGQAAQAMAEVKRAAWWLTMDPRWTLRFYGWVGLPFVALAWTRLRGWPVVRQVAFALAFCGVAWPLFPGDVPVVTFGLAYLPIILPLTFWLVDRIARRWHGAAEDAPAEPDRLARVAWVVALAVSIATALAFAGREGYRAMRRAEIALEAAVVVPRVLGQLRVGGGEEIQVARRLLSQVVEVACVVSQVPVVEDASRQVAAFTARVKDERRLVGLVGEDIRALLAADHDNGGGLSKDERVTLEVADRDQREKAKLLEREVFEVRLLGEKLGLDAVAK